MKNITCLTLKYTLFALAAIVINIAVQRTVFFFDFPHSLFIAMGSGTFAGLILKYILDKKFIFYYKTASLKHDAKKFVLYSFMGGLTTLVFWSIEFFFDRYIKISASKYIGAFIGLTIGYILKYFLDKKIVFVDKVERKE
ncbi:GtrA family protein [candidate division WOR-3 bacterium]|nr:GtrA family protein [candidate division WOR-3 bacterium]